MTSVVVKIVDKTHTIRIERQTVLDANEVERRIRQVILELAK